MNEQKLRDFKAIFEDATLIHLALQNPTIFEIRRCIPKSATILWYCIEQHQTLVIWSEKAMQDGYPDVTEDFFYVGRLAKMSISGGKLKIVTFFKPFENRGFIQHVEACSFFTVHSITSIGCGGLIVCKLKNPLDIDSAIEYIEIYKE